ncbi:ubiquitin carboxyl-terminal hydrolase 36-like [Haematobia irritans]|uniref:ubiquitin carboxyl-terminal hydrolase 36-like n=1 Tax=Haematobia irritans TaxID=7368 RepID=UPI003F50D05E
MDRGRQKKVKAPKDQYNNTTTPGYNPFQEQDNQKRWKRYNYMGGGGGGFRQNFHRNKFKFQRFPHKFGKKNMISSGGMNNIHRRHDS